MNSMKRAAAIVTLSLLAALTGCKEKQAAQETSSVERPVLTASVRSIPAYSLDFPGSIEPQIATQKAFRVPGQVIARNVSVGDRVKKGDILAVLDTSQLKEGVGSAEAGVASAQSQLNNAQSVEERVKTLSKEGFASPAQLESASQNLSAVRARVESAEAQLDKAREQLGYGELKADYDGIVTATSVEVGENVSPGMPAITVARPDLRDAVIDVPEDAQTMIKLGDVFDVATVLQPDVIARGKVREIAPDADKLTHTVRVKISIGNAAGNFRIGTTIKATARKAGKQIELLPLNAVFQENGKSYVWKYDDASSTIVKTAVEGKDTGGGNFAVTSGIDTGSEVAVAGIHSLKDGQKVKRAEELAQ